MNNLKKFTLAMALGLSLFMVSPANAEVGYLDYGKILESYPAAQQAVKDIDAKQLELQQFMVDKERQYKQLDTPLKKQNFEAQTATELKARQEALIKLQGDKESQIMNKIQSIAKSIMVAQHLDAVLSDQVVFVGGVDITDMVIEKLKAGN